MHPCPKKGPHLSLTPSIATAWKTDVAPPDRVRQLPRRHPLIQIETAVTATTHRHRRRRPPPRRSSSPPRAPASSAGPELTGEYCRPFESSRSIASRTGERVHIRHEAFDEQADLTEIRLHVQKHPPLASQVSL